jgi:hypothetical protein
MSTHRRTGFIRLGIVSLGLSLALFAGNGCTESDADSAATAGVTAPQGSSVEALGLPDMNELESRLDLTPEQKEQLAAALENWRSEMKGRRDCLQASRPGGREGKRGEGGGRRAPGEGCEGTPPRLQFLGDAAEILNQEQFLELAAYLTEKQEERRANREDRGFQRGRGFGRGFGRGGGHLAQELGLTEAQAEQVHEAMKAHRQSVHALFEAYAEDNLSLEGLRDGVKSERVAFEQTLAGILDEDQLAQMLERHEQRRTERAERHLERLGQHLERRVEFLTRVLRLDDSQQAQVRSVLEGLLPREKALLEGIAAGEVAFEDAIYERLKIKEDGEEALRAVLTEEQAERLDALEELIRPRRRGFHM